MNTSPLRNQETVCHRVLHQETLILVIASGEINQKIDSRMNIVVVDIPITIINEG